LFIREKTLHSIGFSICLVGSNPSHLIKSNVLHNDIMRYCRPDKWCHDGNQSILCPLYASICGKTSNSLCSSDEYIRDVRIEQGVPGLKDWQLSSKCTRERERETCASS
jgi:hypothetical protein